MESDSATKRNELYVVTWMNLKTYSKKTSKNSDTKVYIQYLLLFSHSVVSDSL